MTSPMTVAVTGATGFVGGATLRLLREQGHNVRALTRRAQPDQEGVVWVPGSLSDTEGLAQLCEGADAVLHIAGAVNAPDEAGFVAANVTGTANVIDAARAGGVGRFVHVSTLAAREPDLSLYSASKSRGEKLVSSSLMDWTIVRPPAVYGPADTEMFEMFRMARKGLAPVPAKGRLSVIHVDDLARLLVALLPAREETAGALFEPDDGTGEGWSHAAFAEAMGQGVGRKVRVLPMPPLLLTLAARIDMALRGPKAKLTLDRAAYFSHPDWTARPAHQPPAHLWQPAVPTHEGLRQTAEWYREKGWY